MGADLGCEARPEPILLLDTVPQSQETAALEGLGWVRKRLTRNLMRRGCGRGRREKDERDDITRESI